MKQMQKAKRHHRSSRGRPELLAAEARDPDIVHAHRIARRSRRPGADRARADGPTPAAPAPGR